MAQLVRLAAFFTYVYICLPAVGLFRVFQGLLAIAGCFCVVADVRWQCVMMPRCGVRPQG